MQETLPIDDFLPEIIAKLQADGALVLVAEPGAGKTTRVPIALSRKWGRTIVTQPRRVAARSSSARVAAEVDCKLGEYVGYQVRGDSKATSETKLVYMTEGVLKARLCQAQGAGSLNEIEVIVLDEFHERTEDIDLIFAALHRLRKESAATTKILIMSATVDAEAIASKLDCQSIQVPGRTYPVTESYHPPPARADWREQVSHFGDLIIKAFESEKEGDVLVFLPGVREIEEAAKRITKRANALSATVEKLHGGLPLKEQKRVVSKNTDARRIVLATNVAETSLTLPDIRVVVDSGKEKVAYESIANIHDLQLQRITKASAIQRAGRAGRVQEGRVFRAYSKPEYFAMDDYLPPEISRSSGLNTLLFAKALKLSTEDFLLSLTTEQRENANHVLEILKISSDSPESRERRLAIARLPLSPRVAAFTLDANAAFSESPHLLWRALMTAVLLESGGIRSAQHKNGPAYASDLVPDLMAVEDFFRGGCNRKQANDLGIDYVSTQQSLRDFSRLERVFGPGLTPPNPTQFHDHMGRIHQLLFCSFWDLCGQATNRKSEYRMVRGGRLRLSSSCSVHFPEYLIAFGTRRTRNQDEIISSMEVQEEWIFEHLEEQIDATESIEYDEKRGPIRRSTLALGDMILDEDIKTATDEEARTFAMLEKAKSLGLSRLLGATWWETWLARSKWALELSNPEFDSWKTRFEKAIWNEVSVYLPTLSSLSDLRRYRKAIAKAATSDYSRIQSAAPETMDLPGRQAVPIYYKKNQRPYLQARIQDFYGLSDTPKIGDGIPLVLHLCAPNDRPQQVTDDLAGFWKQHYPSLSASLKRRYPKHYFPDNPENAKPVRLKRFAK